MRYLFVLLLLLAVSCQKQQEATTFEPAKVPVKAEKPTRQDVPVYVEALGSLHPAASIMVRAQVAGTITHIAVKEGECVEEGRLLFQIDPKPYNIAYNQVQAELASSKARLRAAIKKAARYEKLKDKKLISQNEWDQIETEVDQARAEVALQKSRLQKADLEREYTCIRAPRGGRVGKLQAHVGHLVSLQDAALTEIMSVDTLVAQFHVTEREFTKCSDKIDQVELMLLSHPEKCFSGAFSFCDNSFDRTTGQILLCARVENSDFSLRPGMSVKVKIPVEVMKESLLVPQRAVKHNQFGAYVFVVQEDETVQIRQVILKGEHGSSFVVESGLTADDVVVTEGHQKVAVGTKVDVV